MWSLIVFITEWKGCQHILRVRERLTKTIRQLSFPGFIKIREIGGVLKLRIFPVWKNTIKESIYNERNKKNLD